MRSAFQQTFLQVQKYSTFDELLAPIKRKMKTMEESMKSKNLLEVAEKVKRTKANSTKINKIEFPKLVTEEGWSHTEQKQKTGMNI